MSDSVFLVKGNYYTNLDECAEALKKLIILRDYYNEGWQPDWNSDRNKFCIHVHKGELNCICYSFTFRPLFFKTYEIRNKFLEDQKELLEIAKPLL